MLALMPCTRRKATPALPELRASSLPRNSVEERAVGWVARVGAAKAAMPAESYYKGRGIYLGRNAGCDLGFVSAGLGIVRADRAIPAYDLTIAPGDSENVLDGMVPAVGPTVWWAALRSAFDAVGEARGLSATITAEEGLVLLALTGPYLAMLRDELAELSPESLDRLRLFTSPATPVGDRLEAVRIPYDARLDGPDSPCRGVVGDFAMRALADFAKGIAVQHPDATAIEHGAAVAERLASWRPAATRATRRTATDAELLSEIALARGRGIATASAMLRHLRDAMGIACEQGRMRRLWRASDLSPEDGTR